MAVEGIFKRRLSPLNSPGPYLDSSQPLIRGLVGAWPLINHDLRNYAVGLGNPQTNELDERVTPTGNGVSSSGFMGNIVPELAGSADYFDTGNINVALWTALSVSFWARHDSSGTNEHTIISNLAPSNRGFRLVYEPQGNDSLDFFIVEEAATNRQLTGAGAVAVKTDVIQHIVGVYDPLIEGIMRLYVNGVRQSETTAVTGVMDADTTANNLWIGESPHTANDSLTGSASNGYLWRNRALTDSEVMSLYREPWLLYVRQTQFMPVGTIDVGGANPKGPLGMPLAGALAGPIG